MSINRRILGRPGADNAVLLEIDTGQSIHPLLFDCGERVLDSLRISEIQAIEHLCFSHFHMDHVCGFDTFFRHNYNRSLTPVRVWGPAETIHLLHHRFRSFGWNLHHDQPGDWLVHEVRDGSVACSRFLAREAFAHAHPLPDRPAEPALLESRPFRIEAMALPHLDIPSLAYRVVESDRTNVSHEALKESGLTPGPWLQALIDPHTPADATLEVDGSEHEAGSLRERLLVQSPGESVAILTDFHLEPGEAAWEELCRWLEGTDTLVCECQYGRDDLALAKRNGHMTADQVGLLARDSGVKRLILQHLSRRYDSHEWVAMRDEARESFPAAEFPAEWNLG